MLRLLVCGDRDWNDYPSVLAVVEQWRPDVVIEGECRGADLAGRDAAVDLGIPFLPFPAEWEKYHKAAGARRNQQMLDEANPNRVVAFHDNLCDSRGTRDMLRRAWNAGVESIWLFDHHHGLRDVLTIADFPDWIGV